MQHAKITKNISEFQAFINNNNKTGHCLSETLKFFDTQRIFGRFDFLKQRGVEVSLILKSLLVMLFYRNNNISNLFTRQHESQITIASGKNPYYDIQGNEHVNWRVILYLFAKRFMTLSAHIADHSDKVRALIFDDSLLEKSGKKIENVSRVHDHVSGQFVFGYKILVCGYWDGNSFIPIDFSLHRERGNKLDKARKQANKARQKVKQSVKAYQEHKQKHHEERIKLNQLKSLSAEGNKTIRINLEQQIRKVARSKKKQSILLRNKKKAELILTEKEKVVKEKEVSAPLYGLSPSQHRKQYKKKRAKDSAGFERQTEVDISKIKSVTQMISRAVKKRFEFDYVLLDSWFFSKDILNKIKSFHSKNIQLIAMVKMGSILYLDVLSGENKSAPELRKQYRKQTKRSRKHRAKYIKVAVKYNNQRLNLFFIKIGKGGNWRCLLTTDLKLDFNKLMEIYHIRWSIEVFYRDAKQHLQLGKCQCNNFDAQIGATTIAMIQYIFLLLYKQMHYGQTLGSVFDLISTRVQEDNITKYLMELFWVIVDQIGKILDIDCINLFREIIRDHQRANELMKLFSPIFENKAAG